MEFLAAGEIIGEAHQVRTVGLKDSPQLPDGNYRFVDMYCTDPSCDCRKTIIQVFLNDVHVSTISFGWESAYYYQKWMGSAENADTCMSMRGVSIDIASPNKVPQRGMLAFFSALLDQKWVAKFKSHYAAVKLKMSETTHTEKDNCRTKIFSVPLPRSGATSAES